MRGPWCLVVAELLFNLLTFLYCAPFGKTELKDLAAVSSGSLNSENPYATIKDLPGPPFSSQESSYMEMKSAVPRERAYTEISPPPFSMATLRRGELRPLQVREAFTNTVQV